MNNLEIWVKILGTFTVLASVVYVVLIAYLDKDISAQNERSNDLEGRISRVASSLTSLLSEHAKTSSVLSDAVKVEQEKAIKAGIDLTEAKDKIAFLTTAIRELEKKVEKLEKERIIIPEPTVEAVFSALSEEPTKIDKEKPANEACETVKAKPVKPKKSTTSKPKAAKKAVKTESKTTKKA